MTPLRWLLLLLAFAAGFVAREALLRSAAPSAVVAPSPTLGGRPPSELSRADG